MANGEFVFRFPLSVFRFWNGVVAATAPRMTPANPLCRQRTARQRAMLPDRVHRVLRAGRRETAAAGRAEQKSLGWRNCELVGANGQRQQTNDQ